MIFVYWLFLGVGIIFVLFSFLMLLDIVVKVIRQIQMSYFYMFMTLLFAVVPGMFGYWLITVEYAKILAS